MPPARRGRVCPRCLAGGLSSAEMVPERAAQGLGKFGEYELLSVAGRGGMGVVYRARHVRLGREVALKMVASPVLAGEAAARRFRAEVESMSGLDHPNLMPVYECGEVDGQAFYTMKCVEGGQLSDRLKGSEWPPAEKIRLLVKVARAVDYAHRHGVLHRDLKPSNIMVDSAGEPYVSDFGLARRLEEDSTLTLSGAALGTPEYMAPEQAGGESARVTIAADIYSLGAILYEMLAGRPPFRGGTPLETMRQVVEDEPASPSTLVRTVDRNLETIALKCLAKEPARRYASAASLANDLDRWLRHEPITARRPGTLERTAKWLRRHPALASLLTLCLAGAGVFLWQHLREEERVKSERDRAEAGWANARARHYAADMDAVADALERGDYGVAAAKLETHRDSPERGLEWDIYTRALEGDQVRLLHAEAPVRQLAWSADGRIIAAATTLERVLIWKAAEGALTVTLPDPAVPNEWDLNAWKAREAARRLRHQPAQSTAALLSLVGINKPRTLPHTTSAPAAYGLTFSPDGSLLATADNDGTKFWRLKDHWLHDFLPGHAGRGIFLDNTHYLAAEEDPPHDVGVFDLTAGDWRVLRAGAGRMLSVTPDRRTAAVLHTAAQTLRVLSLPEGALLSEWQDESFGSASSFALVPGTDLFLLHTTSHPRLVEGNWREHLWVRSHGEGIYHDEPLFALKDDHRLLALTDHEQRVRLHQMSDGVMLQPLRGKRSPLLSMAWSPDNLTLATGENDGSVRLWQPEVRRATWPSCDAGLNPVLDLSPDGRLGLGRTATGLCLVDMATLKAREIRPSTTALPAGWRGGEALFLEHTPDGSHIQLLSWHDDRAATLTVLQDAKDWCLRPESHAQSAGSRWLIVSIEDRRELCIYDTTSGALAWSESADWHGLSAALSPDEHTLALASADQTLRLLSWPSGALLSSLDAGTPLLSLTWTPDGQRLVAGCRDGSIRLYLPTGLTPAGSLSGHTDGVWGLHLSPDGRRLVSASNDTRIRLWDMATLQPLGRLPAGPLAARALGGFTEGGNGIAAVLWGGTVFQWRGK